MVAGRVNGAKSLSGSLNKWSVLVAEATTRLSEETYLIKILTKLDCATGDLCNVTKVFVIELEVGGDRGGHAKKLSQKFLQSH